MQLLGQILNQGQGSTQEQAARPSSAATQPTIPAEAYITRPISNAFSLKAKLAIENSAGPATFAFFQGAQRNAGYFLIYDPVAGLQLQRRGASGEITLATGTAALSDGADHEITWTRSEAGEMIVTADGTEILRVTDAAFRNYWAGIGFTNGGGAMPQ